MTGLAKPSMSIHPVATPSVCLVSVEVSSLTVTSDCSCLVKRFRFHQNLLLFFEFRYYPYYSFFFPDGRLESQISETASHSATKLNSYIDPYPTQCSACFGGDPDYHSGSRAKSVFSDSLHYLQNLSSDLQLQYL